MVLEFPSCEKVLRTYGQMDRWTDGKAKTNMPPQLLRSCVIKKHGTESRQLERNIQKYVVGEGQSVSQEVEITMEKVTLDSGGKYFRKV